ncbi:MAG: hypothetical protein KA354_17995 [Phycisphaerae bacterium]|nr:hypothetical protein [Phycisphaerae bacterium]
MCSAAASRSVLLPVVFVSHIGLAVLLAGCSIGCAEWHGRPGGFTGRDAPETDSDLPPLPDRSLRGVFVVTAYNFDWPNRPGLNPRVLSDEIRAVVGRTKELNCNVIILQVRAFGDRLHRWTRLSKPEPWSVALNPGSDRDPDKKPTPEYDPLGDWITQCHAAGIELHAWVNPFRVDRIVKDANDKVYSLLASEKYDTVYLDYTQTNVQDYVIDVIDDLLRYRAKQDVTTVTPGGGALRVARGGDGIDGLLFDHNLPKEHHHRVASRTTVLFSAPPDYTPHQKRVKWLATEYGAPTAGPKTMDDFIFRTFQRVYKEHGLKFGISPNHDDAQGMEWLKKGWVNYVVPELYTKDPPGSVKRRLGPWLGNVQPQTEFTPIVVTGLCATRVQSPEDSSSQPWSGKDIADQMKEANNARSRTGTRTSGEAHYSWSALRAPCCGGPLDAQDPQNTLGELLQREFYVQPALVPNCTAPPGSRLPDKPVVSLANNTASWRLPAHSKTRVRFWAVWLHDSGPRSSGWGPMQVLDGSVSSRPVPRTVDRVAVKAIDHHNRETDYGLAAP